VSVLLAVLLMTAGLNPPRRRAELAARPTVVAAGAVLTVAVLIALGLAGESMLNALDISAPTFRVGVGLVLAIRGAIDLAMRPPAPPAAADGMGAAAVPVFFPVLFRPEAALVAVSVASDGGMGSMLLGAGVALALVVGLAAAELHEMMLRAAGMLVSTLAVVVAIDLIVDGVFAL